jgi:hypothetical protein
MLADSPPTTIEELRARTGPAATGRSASDIAVVLDTLVHEGLVSPAASIVRIK